MAFVIAAVGLTVGAIGGLEVGKLVFGSGTASPQPNRDSPRLSRIQELVDNGTDQELFAEHPLVISSFAILGEHATLLRGIERLAHLCIAGGSQPERRVLAKSLLQLRSYPSVRDLLAPHVAGLEQAAGND